MVCGGGAAAAGGLTKKAPRHPRQASHHTVTKTQRGRHAAAVETTCTYSLLFVGDPHLRGTMDNMLGRSALQLLHPCRG